MTCFLCLFGKSGLRTDEASEDELKIYAYKELCKATNYFSAANKLGEGGFGAVYRAKLRDGTEAAVKVLSNESKQGAREFLNEIKVIANVAHDNLVKLLGCCFEKDKRVLVYEYLENNSLSQRLLDNRGGNVEFNWRARTKICKDIARGLAFLHEEVKPHVVHRDIKASNILLGKNLNAKISDFGLAKLLPPELSHVSTRVAGTMWKQTSTICGTKKQEGRTHTNARGTRKTHGCTWLSEIPTSTVVATDRIGNERIHMGLERMEYQIGRHLNFCLACTYTIGSSIL